MDAATAARARRRFAYLLGFLAVSGAIAAFNLRGVALTPDSLRGTVLSWGAFAPLAYITIVSMRPFIFFPSGLLFIVAGLAFGPWLGTLYAVVGGVIAAIVTFVLARSLGRDFVQARLPARLRRLQDTELGAGLIFLLMLVPIVPMSAVNYGAGLSRVSLAHYTLAVVGGLTPRAFAYCYFGDSLFAVGSPQFIAALAILAVMVIVPALLRRRWMARWR
ncbi:TVP38/TMEM64 family protein [bacterium]|nr:TVP38/TMEM64 family protein [bacterium]